MRIIYLVRPVYGNRFGVYADGRLDLYFKDEPSANRYAANRQKQEDCIHEWEYQEDDYGSLADGGSYEQYCCKLCNQIHYSPLAD